MFLAQENGGEGGSLLFPLLMIAGLFAIFYFLMIRPQRRRKEQQAQLQSSLSVGDEVVTIGGLYGTVAEIDDQTVILETSDGVYSRYARAAISQVTSQGGDSSAETDTDQVGTEPFGSGSSSEHFKSDLESDLKSDLQPDPTADTTAERRDGKD